MNYEKKAKELRQEILKSLFACQSGHPGAPGVGSEFIFSLPKSHQEDEED